jgi:TonB dependent receptor/TonB-dependent Receptor Plug Domain
MSRKTWGTSLASLVFVMRLVRPALAEQHAQPTAPPTADPVPPIEQQASTVPTAEPVPPAAQPPVAQPPVAQPDAPQEVKVTAQRERPVAGSTVLSLDSHARAVPGTMGDALVAVQNLPGVTRPQAGSNTLVLAGSAANETRIYVDDVPIPYLFHRGGLRSVVNASLIQNAELTPAGFSAPYGRAIGGLLRLRTSMLSTEGVSGYAAVDPLDASAALAVRQFDGPWAAAIGVRYGWLDKLVPLVAPNAARTFPLSSFGDVVSKLIHRSDYGVTEVTILGANDSVNRTVPEPFGGAERSETTNTRFARINLRHTWSGGSILVWLGRDVDNTKLGFGGPEAVRETSVKRAGLRFTRTLSIMKGLNARLGADVEGGLYDLRREGTLALPSREGDRRVFGQTPDPRFASDAWEIYRAEAAPYAEVQWQPHPALTLTPAIRLEAFATVGDRLRPKSVAGVDTGYSSFEIYPDPRLRADLQASRTVTLQASFGRYHQAPDPAEMSAVFGAPTLTPSEGLQALLGFVWQGTRAVSVDASLYAKELSDLPARPLGTQTPIAENLSNLERGRSVGAQATVRLAKLRWLSGWLTYQLSSAQRGRIMPGNTTVTWRPFEEEQPHAVTLVASVEPFANWRFGTRLRMASGNPRPRVANAYYNGRNYEPVLLGTERLPLFAQLDFHAEKGGSLGTLGRYVVYVDVINVINRKNAEEFTYGYDYGQRGSLTGFPILALLGLRLER